MDYGMDILFLVVIGTFVIAGAHPASCLGTFPGSKVTEAQS